MHAPDLKTRVFVQKEDRVVFAFSRSTGRPSNGHGRAWQVFEYAFKLTLSLRKSVECHGLRNDKPVGYNDSEHHKQALNGKAQTICQHIRRLRYPAIYWT